MTNKSPAPIDSAKVEDTGEPVALPKDVLDALRFYAHGHHYEIDDDHQQFDTVSGEPTNWMFSEKDDDCTMFEDGGIARAVLTGRSAGFEEPVEPFEGEVFTALSTAPTTGSALWQVGDDTSSVQISRDGSTHKWGCKCEGCAPATGSAPTFGMDRSAFHDKAWALYQSKALDDAKLQRISVHTMRTLWNALYDSMPNAAPTIGSAPAKIILEWIEETCAAYCIPKPFAIIEALLAAPTQGADARPVAGDFAPLTEERKVAIASSVEQRYGESIRSAVDLATRDAAPRVDAQDGATVERNLEGLRAQLLAPRGIVRNAEGWPTHAGARDSDGWLSHPAIPVCDEGTRVDKLLEAFGIETSFVSMESDAADFYDKWCEEGLADCSSWVPTPPAGDGWLLLEIYDTEDGPCALFGRDWYEAEKVRKQAERAERRAAERTRAASAPRDAS